MHSDCLRMIPVDEKDSIGIRWIVLAHPPLQLVYIDMVKRRHSCQFVMVDLACPDPAASSSQFHLQFPINFPQMKWKVFPCWRVIHLELRRTTWNKMPILWKTQRNEHHFRWMEFNLQRTDRPHFGIIIHIKYTLSLDRSQGFGVYYPSLL